MSDSSSPNSAAPDYRAHVGPADRYDLMAANQFTLLAALGLREHHTLLDIGCGSLRGGRLFIPYLLPGHYFGIEPETWVLEAGIEHEIGQDLIRIKQPTFSHDTDFTLTTFDQSFDYMVAQSIFSHATEAQIVRCLAQAKQALKPEGIFAATYMQGAENYTGDEWVYPGCSTYTQDHMIALAAVHDLACQPLDWFHPNRQRWVVYHHPAHTVTLPTADIHIVQTLEAQIARLERSRAAVQARLDEVEQHPYVRVGFGVNRAIRRVWRAILRR